MRAADQWAEIEESLPTEWAEDLLSFTPEGSVADAAAILGPLQPGRVGEELRLDVTRSDGGAGARAQPLRAARPAADLGDARAPRVQEEAHADSAAPDVAAATSLVESWHEVLSELPPDWSDLLCELELDSSDHLPRAALLGAPLNPTRVVDANALRFRCSGKQGYGVSPGMARRCFERMDAEGIAGRITIVQALSDTENAVTQGPVWRVAGRSV